MNLLGIVLLLQSNGLVLTAANRVARPEERVCFRGGRPEEADDRKKPEHVLYQPRSRREECITQLVCKQDAFLIGHTTEHD
jgi:hypothetical protein